MSKKAAEPIIIVGGGSGGTTLAKLLDKSLRSTPHPVIVIERRNTYHHNIGAMRAATKKDFVNEVLIPYTRLFTNSNGSAIINGTVKKLNNILVTVELDDGKIIELTFAFLIIAVGAVHNRPFKFEHDTKMAAIKEQYVDYVQKVTKAQKIGVIGGGPVGSELAGEILHWFPKKEVILVHSHDHLCNGANVKPGLGKSVETRLRRKGQDRLTMHFNKRAEINDDDDKIVLDINGEKQEVDLLFQCTGTKPRPRKDTPYKDLLDISFDGDKLVVDKHFRVNGQEIIFAIGDCMSNPTEDPATFVSVATQATYLAKYLTKLITRDKVTADKLVYKPMTVQIVTVGPEDGAAQLFGIIFGGMFAKMMKSSDVMTEKAWKEKGAVDKENNHIRNYEYRSKESKQTEWKTVEVKQKALEALPKELWDHILS